MIPARPQAQELSMQLFLLPSIELIERIRVRLKPKEIQQNYLQQKPLAKFVKLPEPSKQNSPIFKPLLKFQESFLTYIRAFDLSHSPDPSVSDTKMGISQKEFYYYRNKDGTLTYEAKDQVVSEGQKRDREVEAPVYCKDHTERGGRSDAIEVKEFTESKEKYAAFKNQMNCLFLAYQNLFEESRNFFAKDTGLKDKDFQESFKKFKDNLVRFKTLYLSEFYADLRATLYGKGKRLLERIFVLIKTNPTDSKKDMLTELDEVIREIAGGSCAGGFVSRLSNFTTRIAGGDLKARVFSWFSEQISFIANDHAGWQRSQGNEVHYFSAYMREYLSVLDPQMTHTKLCRAEILLFHQDVVLKVNTKTLLTFLIGDLKKKLFRIQQEYEEVLPALSSEEEKRDAFTTAFNGGLAASLSEYSLTEREFRDLLVADALEKSQFVFPEDLDKRIFKLLLSKLAKDVLEIPDYEVQVIGDDIEVLQKLRDLDLDTRVKTLEEALHPKEVVDNQRPNTDKIVLNKADIARLASDIQRTKQDMAYYQDSYATALIQDFIIPPLIPYCKEIARRLMAGSSVGGDYWLYQKAAGMLELYYPAGEITREDIVAFYRQAADLLPKSVFEQADTAQAIKVAENYKQVGEALQRLQLSDDDLLRAVRCYQVALQCFPKNRQEKCVPFMMELCDRIISLLQSSKKTSLMYQNDILECLCKIGDLHGKKRDSVAAQRFESAADELLARIQKDRAKQQEISVSGDRLEKLVKLYEFAINCIDDTDSTEKQRLYAKGEQSLRAVGGDVQKWLRQRSQYSRDRSISFQETKEWKEAAQFAGMAASQWLQQEPLTEVDIKSGVTYYMEALACLDKLDTKDTETTRTFREAAADALNQLQSLTEQEAKQMVSLYEGVLKGIDKWQDFQQEFPKNYQFYEKVGDAKHKLFSLVCRQYEKRGDVKSQFLEFLSRKDGVGGVGDEYLYAIQLVKSKIDHFRGSRDSKEYRELLSVQAKLHTKYADFLAEYERQPPCPPQPQLRKIIEHYQTALASIEARYGDRPGNADKWLYVAKTNQKLANAIPSSQIDPSYIAICIGASNQAADAFELLNAWQEQAEVYQSLAEKLQGWKSVSGNQPFHEAKYYRKAAKALDKVKGVEEKVFSLYEKAASINAANEQWEEASELYEEAAPDFEPIWR